LHSTTEFIGDKTIANKTVMTMTKSVTSLHYC